MSINDAGMRSRRVYTGLFLLVLLGVSAYLGAKPERSAGTAAVPVTRRSLESAENTAHERMTLTQVQQRLDAEREKEIGLLEAVLAGDGAEAKENAAAQKEELLRRMETEAQARFILDGLGAASAVCCGAGMITVFLEEIAGTDTEQMVRLHEAVCSQTGMAADNVKIILVKNET